MALLVYMVFPLAIYMLNLVHGWLTDTLQQFI